jgi:2-polyprenyl-3-methyl-5-hydroxy-6-metoxy-1,4-benzoquinol methylase
VSDSPASTSLLLQSRRRAIAVHFAIPLYREWDGDTPAPMRPSIALKIHDGERQGAAVVSGAPLWSYIATLPLPKPPAKAVACYLSVELELSQGAVGICAVDDRGRILSGEIVATKSGRYDITASRAARALCLRQRAEGRSTFQAVRCDCFWRVPFQLTSVEGILPVMLKHPGEPALRAIAARLGRDWREIGALNISRSSVDLKFPELWAQGDERSIFEWTDELVRLVDRYDPAALGVNVSSVALPRDFVRTYLRMTTTRVMHLVAKLKALGLSSGRILEIGGAFGSFAYVLQRLGYQVTVIDRYADFNHSIDAFLDLMRAAGVEVIMASRDDEVERTARLGKFDAVIAMAVIEHIPHTPRLFLDMMLSHVRRGGLLALDTPNIARYWARQRINTGLSPYSNIESQFVSAIPFEGHHREYAADELRWMMTKLDLRDVQSELFDYNLLQFNRLEGDHLDAFLKITVDPSLADTVLCIGRKETD